MTIYVSDHTIVRIKPDSDEPCAERPLKKHWLKSAMDTIIFLLRGY